MIKIDPECAKSLEHLAFDKGFQEQTKAMFILNPHLSDLILSIYNRTISIIIKNDSNITESSREEIEEGIALGVISMYQLIRIQMESNDLKTSL